MIDSTVFFSFRDLSLKVDRPFEVRYNPYTQSIETLTSSGNLVDLASELKGDIHVIRNAIEKLKVISKKS